MSTPLGVQLEAAQTSQDVSDLVNEYGHEFDFYPGTEPVITRDKYNSIKTQPSTFFTLKAYPVQETPTQNQLKKAGFFEKMDAIIYTAYQDWTAKGYGFKDIDTVRSQVVIHDTTYNVKEKNRDVEIGDDHMYIILGLTIK